MRYVIWRDAEVAELADAHGSGPCDSNIMRVQVPSSAPAKRPAAALKGSGAACGSFAFYVRWKAAEKNGTKRPLNDTKRPGNVLTGFFQNGIILRERCHFMRKLTHGICAYFKALCAWLWCKDQGKRIREETWLRGSQGETTIWRRNEKISCS